jgi:hypothetical protein
MFKVSTVSLHALFETPLLDSVIDNTPVERSPFLDEMFLQMLNVSYPATVYSLLQHPPDFVVNK